MKFKSALTVVILTIASTNSIFAQSNFRSLNWGVSKASVKETEKSSLVLEQPNQLVYDFLVAESKTKIVYTFTSSDKLMRAKYFITPDHFNTIFYIRDFRLFENALIQKYGQPEVVSPKVINKESVKDDEWAAYLSAGELFVEARWISGKTEIQLTMSKTDAYPAIQIDYISIDLSKQDLQEKTKQILEIL